MNVTVAEFLEARIAEDEERYSGARMLIPGRKEQLEIAHRVRVLRECEAYRAILALGMEHPSGYGMEHRLFCDGYNSAGGDALYALARVWRDHPDYDPNWERT